MFDFEIHPLEPKYRVTKLLISHYPAFIKSARAKLKNQADAEDAVQETCLRIANYYSGHLENATEERQMGYIWLTLHNVINNIGAKKGQFTTVSLSELPYDLPAPEQNLEPDISPHEALEQLIEALDFSEKVKSILRYKGIYNLRTEEIAGLLEMKPGAVRTAFSRAKRQLRKAHDAEVGKGAEHEKTRV